MPLIELSDAVEVVDGYKRRNPDSWSLCNSIRCDIGDLPTISPDEVRGVGEWIMLENQSKEDTDNGNYWYTCSHCSAGDLHAKVQEVPFCWRCGARMKGASENA